MTDLPRPDPAAQAQSPRIAPAPPGTALAPSAVSSRADASRPRAATSWAAVTRRPAFRVAIVALLAAAGVLAWWLLKPKGLPAGFAKANGRIEATEIDISPKIPARIREIRAHEGDFVTAGEVLVVMDTDKLQAERAEAKAEAQRALTNIDTARSRVRQAEADKAAAEALTLQREAELDGKRRHLARSERLAPRGVVPEQTLDDDRANVRAAEAALSAARAQVAAAEAAIATYNSDVIAAQAQLDAARATIQRIQADIDDSILSSPRDGRVQYRPAEPGEVLDAGGRVLNLIDLTDVYMTFFLPTATAGRVALGAEVRLVLDAAPQWVIPARVTYVSDVAQFTPKTVETEEERLKLMFRIKANMDPAGLRKHMRMVKTGLPGMAYVQLDPNAAWPPELQVRLPPE
jgi:HlyD family secretion protein